MSTNDQITRIRSAKAAIKAAIAGKGVNVPDSALIDGYSEYVKDIEQIDLSADTVTPADVRTGVTFHAADGEQKTGSLADRGAVSQTLDASNTSYTVPAGIHNGAGKVSITTQEKSVTPSTSAQTVTPDSGKVLSKVSVSAVASATQATPSISVSSSGLITASATQSAGYVAAGTKSATKQLTTKGATTVTPSSSVQTVVNAGTYCTGDIKVAASTGKTVYSGTFTPTADTGSAGTATSITIDTGVTLGDNDQIYLFADIGSGTLSSATIFTARRISSSDKAVVGLNTSSKVIITGTSNASITYSGSKVTASYTGTPRATFSTYITYRWIVIKS